METIGINIIVFLFLPYIILQKCTYLKYGWNENLLTPDDSAIVRGIAAIFVVFSHFLTLQGKQVYNLGPAILFRWTGGLGVCIFFFISGYGLWTKYQDNIITCHFLWKRFKNIIPTVLVLRFIFAFLLKTYQKGYKYFLLYTLNIEAPLWFITEIIIIYILYYIAAKVGKKHRIFLMTGLLILMSIIFYLLDMDERWYNANLVFTAGMLFAKYRVNFLIFYQKHYWIKLGLNVFLFIICSVGFSLFKGRLLAISLKLIAGSLFSICLVAVLMKIQVNSRLLLFIGKYSLQIYVIHLSLRELISITIGRRSPLLFFSLGFISTFLLTIIYQYIERKIRNVISTSFCI